MAIERLWAAWRDAYVASASSPTVEGPARECIFCAILAAPEPADETYVVWTGARSWVVLNAFPYGSGHLLVLPRRHVGELEDLDAAEAAALWATVADAVAAVKAAYTPDGVNVGANLGHGAGAGIPGHLHVHVLPRWAGDTNFMTAIAETRVLPESLDAAWRKLSAAWSATTA